MNFAKPPLENTRHGKYKDHRNHVVNLANVNSIVKSRMNYYPDNEGIPIIVFCHDKEEHTHWYFDDEEMRDRTFTDLIADC